MSAAVGKLKAKDARILALINEVREEPSIWDRRLPSYNASAEKVQIWDRIARECGFEGEKEARDKWSYLRGEFSKHARAQNAGLSKNSKSEWKYFDDLAFLIPIYSNFDQTQAGDDLEAAIAEKGDEEGEKSTPYKLRTRHQVVPSQKSPSGLRAPPPLRLMKRQTQDHSLSSGNISSKPQPEKRLRNHVSDYRQPRNAGRFQPRGQFKHMQLNFNRSFAGIGDELSDLRKVTGSSSGFGTTYTTLPRMQGADMASFSHQIINVQNLDESSLNASNGDIDLNVTVEDDPLFVDNEHTLENDIFYVPKKLAATLPPADQHRDLMIRQNNNQSTTFDSREAVTRWIQAERVRRGLKWNEIAAHVGQSKEWTTAACLGQMQMKKAQAECVAQLFGLNEEGCVWLQQVPLRGRDAASGSGSSKNSVEDPTIARFYEVLSVYGSTLKELLHEEFGDGIMSAVDFCVRMERGQAGPAGGAERVRIVWDGKFLPYKPF